MTETVTNKNISATAKNLLGLTGHTLIEQRVTFLHYITKADVPLKFTESEKL
jgi:hypothetical protein